MKTILETTATLATLYALAIMATLCGVAMGAIDPHDASTWSNHVRSVAQLIITK